MAASSHTALNLIKNQYDVLLITECAHPFDEFRIRRINTAFALYRLHNNCTGLVGNLCFHAFKIIEICKFDSSDQWFEWILIVGITGYG